MAYLMNNLTIVAQIFTRFTSNLVAKIQFFKQDPTLASMLGDFYSNLLITL